jgi:hypothetical protein
LLIDEFGYLNLKPEQSNTFFKLMEERDHRHLSLIPLTPSPTASHFTGIFGLPVFGSGGIGCRVNGCEPLLVYLSL